MQRIQQQQLGDHFQNKDNMFKQAKGKMVNTKDFSNSNHTSERIYDKYVVWTAGIIGVIAILYIIIRIIKF